MSASSARRRRERATRALAWFHRWLGIATCLIFALWFASGAVLLFQPFPALPRAARLALERPVDAAAVRIPLAQALAAAGAAPEAMRLVQRGDVPVYVVALQDGLVAIDARTGARLAPLDRAAAQVIARRVGGPDARVVGPFDYDQWIVHNQFDPLRPFFRIDAGDPPGTRYYLSARTGEIVQRTDRAQRGWNWVGAVLHWAYFTPLRASFTAWDRSVWWVSLVAMLVAIAGTILGVIRTLAARRLRTPALTFFRLRWMRWHHLLGLVASLFVLGWILSDWLSMDHGRLFSRGQASPAARAAYAGAPLARVLASVAPTALAGRGPVAEIAFGAAGGAPVVTAWGADGRPQPMDARGTPLSAAALTAWIARGIAAAWPGGAVAPPDRPGATDFYALAEGWPAGALRFVDPAGRRPDIVVDGADGSLLTVLDPSRKAYAWVYYGLHTFNVPGLAQRPWLRRIAVLVPLLLGFAFSVTGVVVGWQRLRKTVRPAPPRGA